MRWRLLRGAFSITAAMTGLLLVYGVGFAMEAMTTRIPSTAVHELLTVTLWTLPWILLCCSGLEDFVTVTEISAVFWLGVALILVFLCSNERHTGDSTLTKITMPLLATLGGLLPHVVQRLRFLFTVLSLLAGIAGVFVLYLSMKALFSAGFFASKGIGVVIVSFGVAALGTSVLSVGFLFGHQPKLRKLSD